MQDQVAEVIEEIRPYINMDGGDIELLGVDTDTGIVTVRLMGACDSCSMTMITLKAGLETRLKQVVPGVTEVVQV
ncbi:MAG: NifU family protein [Euryarchaeota archaeon]|nr:NifU family protein [Euryarchaeota archaeon]